MLPNKEDANAANIGLSNIEGKSNKAMGRRYKRLRAATKTNGKQDKS